MKCLMWTTSKSLEVVSMIVSADGIFIRYIVSRHSHRLFLFTDYCDEWKKLRLEWVADLISLVNFHSKFTIWLQEASIEELPTSSFYQGSSVHLIQLDQFHACLLDWCKNVYEHWKNFITEEVFLMMSIYLIFSVVLYELFIYEVCK